MHKGDVGEYEQECKSSAHGTTGRGNGGVMVGLGEVGILSHFNAFPGTIWPELD